MKRQTQKTGVRTYFGDDLVDLQTQPLNAIDAMLAAAGQCVISGCAVNQNGDKYDIAPGYVALEATDQTTGAVRIMAMPFAGVSGVTLPVYLMASVDVVERAYGDGAVKPIAYAYNATASAVKPVQNTSIEITAGYTRGLSDALAESLAKYIAVTATEKAVWNAKETPAGAQTKADAAKTAAVATAKTYTDSAVTGKANANHSHGIATAAADGFMAKGDKSKLDGVAAGANNYTHPTDANTRHVTDAEKATWNGKVNATANNGMRCEGMRDTGLPSLHNKISTEIKKDGVYFEASLRPIGDIQGHIGRDGITLPSSAVMNMPGVLCAGSVGWGMVSESWGCKPFVVEKHNGFVGNYKITHNIGHLDYFITANVHSAVNAFSGYVNIAEKRSNYVVVVTKNYETIADTTFDFMICGRN